MKRSLLHTQLDRVRKQIAAAGNREDARSSASKGRTREDVLLRFLKEALPGAIRLSSGDIVDASGAQSGQLEIILESSFAPSVPEFGASEVKVHLAEGVIAVVEVKSDLSGQWKEVERTASKVRLLRRSWGGASYAEGTDPDRIPVYAIGYRGWKSIESARRRVDDGTVSGVFVFESDIHVSRFMTTQGDGAGLMGLLWSLYFESKSIMSMSTRIDEYF